MRAVVFESEEPPDAGVGRLSENEAAIRAKIDAASGDELFFAVRMLAEEYEEQGGPNALLAAGLRWLAAHQRRPWHFKDTSSYDFYFCGEAYIESFDAIPTERFGGGGRSGFLAASFQGFPSKSAAYLAAAKAFLETGRG